MRIPDYLIYDEIKRRRDKDVHRRAHLELPLYRPEIERYGEPDSEADEDRDNSNRGVAIIDMNDLPEDDSSED